LTQNLGGKGIMIKRMRFCLDAKIHLMVAVLCLFSFFACDNSNRKKNINKTAVERKDLENDNKNLRDDDNQNNLSNKFTEKKQDSLSKPFDVLLQLQRPKKEKVLQNISSLINKMFLSKKNLTDRNKKDIQDKVNSFYYIQIVLSSGAVAEGVCEGHMRWNGRTHEPSNEIYCIKYKLVESEFEKRSERKLDYYSFIQSKAPNVYYKMNDIRKIKFLIDEKKSYYSWNSGVRSGYHIYTKTIVEFKDGSEEELYTFRPGRGNAWDEIGTLKVWDGHGWVSYGPNSIAGFNIFKLDDFS
jgi:hypothetical protein